MCSHQGKVLDHPGCESTCQGCEWVLEHLSYTKQGTDCLFNWKVKRHMCDFQTRETFEGTTLVPCNQSTTLTFYCDSGEQCPGYELKLTGDPCPTPPT